MLLEFLRLAVGLTVLCFYRQIADFVLDRDRELVVLFHQRGLRLPMTPSRESMRNIYFLIGMAVVLFQLLRIWMKM